MIGFGFLVLPAIVYGVGVRLLGEYRPGGGMGLFYGDLYRALGRGEGWAWLLLLGPYLGIMAIRLMWLPVRGRRGAEPGPGAEA